MLIITSKLPYRRQPSSPVSVNWAHPLANGLQVYCLIGHRVINLCNNDIAIEQSRTAITVSAIDNEVALSSPPASSANIDLGDSSFLQSKTYLTLFGAISYPNGISNASIITAGTTNDRITFGWANNTILRCNIENGGTSQSRFTSIPTIGDYNKIAAVFDGSLTGNSNRLKMYLSGLKQNVTYVGGVPASTTSSLATNLFIANNSATSGAGGTALIGGPPIIYLRALSDEEIFELSQNPYQMLVPTLSRRYFLQTGGGEQLLSVTASDETGIGYSLTTTQPRNIEFVVGTESGTGYVLGVTQPKTLAITAGAEAGEAYDIGVTQPHTIVVTDGTETGTGEALNLLQPRNLEVVEGEEAGIGYTLDISTGASQTLSVDCGSGTDIGYPLSILQPRTIGLTTSTEIGIGYALDIPLPGPVLSIDPGEELCFGSACSIIQLGRKYPYTRPVKGLTTRYYTGRL